MNSVAGRRVWSHIAGLDSASELNIATQNIISLFEISCYHQIKKNGSVLTVTEKVSRCRFKSNVRRSVNNQFVFRCTS